MNSEIKAIFNRYKNILIDNFVNKSVSKFLPRPINKRSNNTSKSKNNLTCFLKKKCLNKDILVSNKWLQLVNNTGVSHFYSCYDIAFFGPKKKRLIWKGSKKEISWKIKINLVIQKCPNSKVNLYYYKIYSC